MQLINGFIHGVQCGGLMCLAIALLVLIESATDHKRSSFKDRW